MPFDWLIFMRILQAILKILTMLPAETDHRPITGALDQATDIVLNGGDQNK